MKIQNVIDHIESSQKELVNHKIYSKISSVDELKIFSSTLTQQRSYTHLGFAEKIVKTKLQINLELFDGSCEQFVFLGLFSETFSSFFSAAQN